MSDERPEESRTDDVSERPSGGQAQDGGEAAEDGIADGSPPEDAAGSENPEVAEMHGEAQDEDTEAAPSDLDSEHPEDPARSLDEARREAQAHMETALRARAELENVRRRAERDVANAHRYGLERFVNEFLPVRDSLELGVSAAGDDADIARVREGMELTLKLMAAAFDKLGLDVVDPAGEPFDPELHQAMTMQEGQEGQSGSVLTVVQKGYRLNERLVRPALVVVAK
jgi:molecular chaperone GrpE